MGDFSAPKKVGKMPNFSKSNKGAAKKKAEDKESEPINEDEQPAAAQVNDPSDIAIKPLNKNKDPFADAYPPGQGPPVEDDIPIKSMKDAKDPFADAYPPGMKPPEDMGDLKSEMTSSKPKAKKPTMTQKKKEMP